MQQIGRYKILKRLGSGGFGEVWLGLDETIDREVAIKIFKPKDDNLIAFATSTDDEGLEVLRARFVNEARILSSLQDARHVVNVLEFGELEDGSPYYVMRYLPNSLTDLLGKDVFDAAAVAELPESDQPRALPLEQALDYLEQIIEGVAEAHAEGLVHRDIKPSNIMLTDKGEIRLVDFGIAKAPDGGHSTVSQLGMGSRNYMAPEQRQSAKHVDATADVFAVGVVAYRIITGRLPEGRFADPNVAVPELHQRINDLILDCLHQEKADRPADGSVLLERFRAARAAQGEVDESTGTWINTGESSVRDELKPLRAQIEALLLKHGEVPTSEIRKLTALAHIADLDGDGLDALIGSVADANEAQVRPIRKLLGLIESQVAADDLDPDSLYAAGEAIGWSNAQVDAAITARTSEQAAAVEALDKPPKEPPGEPPKTDSPDPAPNKIRREPTSSSSTGKVIGALVALVVLAAGGWWGYGVYKQARDYRDKEHEQATIDQAEQSAWEEAERLNTVAGYEAYQANLAATPERKAQAATRIEKIKAAVELEQQSDIAAGEQSSTERSDTLDVKLNDESVQDLPDAKTEAKFASQSKDPKTESGQSEANDRNEPGSSFKDCDTCPEMVIIPGGTFQMGSNNGDVTAKPVHRVTISRPFAIGKYEVTFDEFDAFTRATNRSPYDDLGWGRNNRPVTRVDWNTATEYAKWLSDKTGKSYRLPTEAEWEYAARAGSAKEYSWGDKIHCGQARYGQHNGECGNARRTVPVGSYAANQYGLFDMHGNLHEWVLDCWNDSYQGAPSDGSAWNSGNCDRRVVRGGSFRYDFSLKSYDRGSLRYDWWDDYSGFRLALDLPASSISIDDSRINDSNLKKETETVSDPNLMFKDAEIAVASVQEEKPIEPAPATGPLMPAITDAARDFLSSGYGVQSALKLMGYDLTVDGLVGAGTKRLISRFQKDNGFSGSSEIGEQLGGQLIDALKQKDAEIWSRVDASQSLALYHLYTQTMPFGNHSREADNRAWDIAADTNSQASYQLYLELSTFGAHRAEAKERKKRFIQTIKDCEICPELVVVPAGRFEMGDTRTYWATPISTPIRTVRVSEFALGKFEITSREFDAFLDDSGWKPTYERYTSGQEDLPIVVYREDAAAYVDWLSSRTNQRYRLPSEAEWEYAARADSSSRFSWGEFVDCSMATFGRSGWGEMCWMGDGGRQRGPVGNYLSNKFGLHDMHGNVEEMTGDCWNDNYVGAPSDGSPWMLGNCERFPVRGGDFDSSSAKISAGIRSSGGGSWAYGFRVARDL